MESTVGSVLPFFNAPAPVAEYIASACRVIRGASTCRFQRAKASGGLHRAKAFSVIRGASSSRFQRASASGGLHRDNASCVIRGATSRRLRCSSARGGVHRASASRNCGTYIRGRVNHEPLWLEVVVSFSRRIMLRKGWSSVQVPDGWLQVIRGPRPKSVQWPVQSRLPTSAQSPGTPPPPFPRGRWRSGDPPNRREQNSVTAIERALAALEPEDVSVKYGLETVLRRAKDKAKAATPSRAPVPVVTFEAARVKVVKLEAALAALSDCA